MKSRQVKRSKSLRLNFYVVFQVSTRSSLSQMLFKIGVLKSFAKFIGKCLCQSLFLNKVAGLRPATLLKKDLGTDVLCEFCENFKNTFFLRTPPLAVSVQLY